MRVLRSLPEEILLVILAFDSLASAHVGARALHPRTLLARLEATSTASPYPLQFDGHSNATLTGAVPGSMVTAPPRCPQLTSRYGYTQHNVPVSGTGHDYAYACDMDKASWSSASLQWYRCILGTTGKTTSTSTIYVLTGTGSAPYTTLCDGYARAHGAPTTLGSTTKLVTTYVDIIDQIVTRPIKPECMTGTATPVFPIPSPSCSVNNNDCVSLLSSFVQTGTTPYQAIGASDAPNCVATGLEYSSILKNTPREACQIGGNKVDLFFWPVDLEDADCPDSRKSITQPPSSVVQTAVVHGITVTSPDALLALDWFAATFANALDNPIHPYKPALLNFTDVKLKVPQTALSTFVATVPGQNWRDSLAYMFGDSFVPQGFNLTTITRPYDFANIQAPVAASDYFFGHYDLYNLISDNFRHNTIFDDYHPRLSAPQQLRDIDPRLSACSFDIVGFYDPPVVLTANANIVTPTLTNPFASATSAPAQPPQDRPSQPQPTPFQGGVPSSSPGSDSGSSQGHPGSSSSGSSSGGSTNGGGSRNGAASNSGSKDPSGGSGPSSGTAGNGANDGSGSSGPSPPISSSGDSPAAIGAGVPGPGSSNSDSSMGGDGRGKIGAPPQSQLNAPGESGAQSGGASSSDSGGINLMNAVIIDGKTITAGGPGAMVTGQDVRLNTQGGIVLGGGTRTVSADVKSLVMNGGTYKVQAVAASSQTMAGASSNTDLAANAPTAQPSQTPFGAGPFPTSAAGSGPSSGSNPSDPAASSTSSPLPTTIVGGTSRDPSPGSERTPRSSPSSSSQSGASLDITLPVALLVMAFILASFCAC